LYWLNKNLYLCKNENKYKEMSNQQEIAESLRDKIQRFISLYERTKAERDSLSLDRKTLEFQIAQQQKIIKELEDKYKKVQLAEAFKATSSDTRDAKLKVGKIVKEIDKCIALLNK